jgi:hypothetical protein
MENLFDMSTFEKNFEDYKIEGEIDKYTFRASKKYMISSSIFFIVLTGTAVYSLYKQFMGLEKMSAIKIILGVILLLYVIISTVVLVGYKLTVDKNEIANSRVRVKLSNVKALFVKIDKVKGQKFERVLEVITKDKKSIKFILNIDNPLLFLKLVEKRSGVKIEFENGKKI